MNYPGTKRPQRRYRLNGKKMVGALFMLVFIAAVIVVAAMALENAAKVEAAARDSESPTADKLLETASAATSGATPGAAAATATQTANVATPVKTTQVSDSPSGDGLQGRLVVVDAGHGGFDPGTTGVSGVREDEVNLAVAKCVKAELEGRGAEVIMTRKDDDAIGDTKSADMAERKRIIEESGSDIVISIHMNSFKDDPKVSGPLVLYMTGSQRGQQLAQAVIDSMNTALGTDGSIRGEDDLIILKSGNQPCVLVECGYLSNKEEESKLQQPDYQKKIAQAICDGAADFL
jgi:N-acetylmuramoyl-L-alanine amidase